MNTITSKKIMIVEDDDNTGKVIDIMLKSQGYTTILVDKDFENSLKIARKSKPDLVLMDIQLIDISGTDLIEEFKLDPHLVNIPIIAITALTNEASKNKIMNHSECDAYISKPFDSEDLIKMVRSYLK